MTNEEYGNHCAEIMGWFKVIAIANYWHSDVSYIMPVSDWQPWQDDAQALRVVEKLDKNLHLQQEEDKWYAWFSKVHTGWQDGDTPALAIKGAIEMLKEATK